MTSFKPAPAQHGIACLGLAFDRWTAFLDEHPPRPMETDVVAADLNLRANSLAIDVVRWVRSIDDYLCAHGTDLPPLPDYRAARAADAEITDLLDGIRYAANKSLHLLVSLAMTPAVYLKAEGWLGSSPPSRRVNAPIYLWPDLSCLPAYQKKRSDEADQRAYAGQLARRELDPTLRRAVGWLRTRRLAD